MKFLFSFGKGLILIFLFVVFILAGVNDTVDHCAIASDGRHLYILNNSGLLKIGSGYGGTIRGSVVSQKDRFQTNKSPWLAFAKVNLLHLFFFFMRSYAD